MNGTGLTKKKEQVSYKYDIDVYDSTSEKERTLSAITYLGDVGTKKQITIKSGAMHEQHIVEIKSIRQYAK